MLSLIASLFGCTSGPALTTDPGDLPEAYVKPVPELPGKLAGVTHESSAGSMEWGTEFAIDLVPEEILHCEYWDLNANRDHMMQRDHVAITASQWADVEKAVLGLWGVWEEIPESVLNYEPDPDLQILDGGDYNRWWLTWETEEGTKKIQYYYPNDRRILTLTALLEELAQPQGRKIEWYELPELSGATYINDKTDMSFQCNWWDLPKSAKEGYRFIVRFTQNGEKIDVYDKAPASVWEAAKPAFAWINPDDFERGGYQNPIVLSLYYSDGTQTTLKLDKKTAAVFEGYLRQLTLDYLEQK